MNAPEPAVMPALDTHRLRRILLAAGAVFAALFVAGVVPRLVLRHQLQTDADTVRTGLPLVSTTNPRRAPEVIETYVGRGNEEKAHPDSTSSIGWSRIIVPDYNPRRRVACAGRVVPATTRSAISS